MANAHTQNGNGVIPQTDAHMVPSSVQDERDTIGASLLFPEVVPRLEETVSPSDFYLEKHRRIWTCMCSLAARGIPPTPGLVRGELAAQNWLDDIGGKSYLDELAAASQSPHFVEHHAEVVARTSLQRQLIQAGADIQALGFTPATREDVPLRMQEAFRLVDTVMRAQPGRRIATMTELTEAFYDEFASAEPGAATRAVPTNFVDLDRLLGGLQPSDLLLLAARPSQGKSALALSIAHNVARQGYRVVIFSLEMGREQLYQRLLSIETGIETQRLRGGQVFESDTQTIIDALARLDQLPIAIDDTPALSLAALRSREREARASLGSVDLVIVDYLQLMRGTADRRIDEVGEISRGLKALARELDIPVLALSQLSRAVESRVTKIPMLSDLRETGALEQDADVVAFIHRPEVYDRETDQKGVAEIHIAKHRNGPLGVIPLRFETKTTAFQNLARFQGVPGFDGDPEGGAKL